MSRTIRVRKTDLSPTMVRWSGPVRFLGTTTFAYCPRHAVEEVGKSIGVPSYYSLIQALRKLEENAVADGIDREKHPACVIFTAQCESCDSNKAVVVAALPYLAIFLYKEKIIDEMLVPTGEVLLKAVKEAVCADYHNLGKFGMILAADSKSIGHFLLDEYMNISFPLELCPEFTKIRAKFTDLKLDVAKAMESIKVEISELKEYFSVYKAHLKSHIASCKKITELIGLVGENCSLINVALLENAVERFKVEGAKPALKNIEKKLTNFIKMDDLYETF
uniref:Uncharacterized protein n=1 Tax=Amphimedon queenslandica TaxID=400682 RepID=A0A1X7SVX1_AMPQE